MPTPLTTERFEEFVDLWTGRQAEVDERFNAVDRRLEAIEQLLWHGQRLSEIEDRFRKLAERTGNADLAAPLTRPFGS
jgi:hypothetical protein